MNNDDIASTAAHTNPEQTPATPNTRGADPTPSAARRPCHTEPGTRELTLATTTSADHAAGLPTLIPGATSASIQRDGRLYAPAKPRDLAASFDATHVTPSDQVNVRQYQVKQSVNANPVSPSANYRVTRCPFRINGTRSP